VFSLSILVVGIASNRQPPYPENPFQSIIYHIATLRSTLRKYLSDTIAVPEVSSPLIPKPAVGNDYFSSSQTTNIHSTLYSLSC
jgi:hypothetical protein